MLFQEIDAGHVWHKDVDCRMRRSDAYNEAPKKHIRKHAVEFVILPEIEVDKITTD